MRLGDWAFFYHSSCGKATGLYGVVEVVREAYPDLGALNPKSKYYDASAPDDGSKWSCIDVKLVEKWATPVLLPKLKECPAIENMLLFKQSRLSVSAVDESHWNVICTELR